jgi:hypothetical protein
MSLGSITNLLSDVPRPTDLGAGQILLQSRGPGELFFGENSGPTVPNTSTEQQLRTCKQPPFRQALSAVNIAAVASEDTDTRAPLFAGLAVAARKEVGGSGKGRSVVHRARGRVVAYETSTEQVWAFVHHRDGSQISHISACNS